MVDNFEGITFTDDENLSGEEKIIELVTFPGNPLGIFSKPVYNNSILVYDTVYYWPSLTNLDVYGKLDHEIVIFSLSKLTGHGKKKK